jgi:hypothetical protein
VVVAEWLTDFLPSGVQTLLTPHVLLVFTIFGIASFVASVVGVPLFLARIPADYFSGRELRARGIPKPERSALQILLLILRNLLGALLVVCGILALVLPGQGVLTILVGVLLMNFPGKRRFERWLLARAPVLRVINGLRRRAGKVPLEPRASWAPPAPDEKPDSRELEEP